MCRVDRAGSGHMRLGVQCVPGWGGVCRKWDRDEFRRRQQREIRPGPISPCWGKAS
jgi:hypothetical protein